MVVYKNRRSYSRFPAIVVYFQEGAQEEAATHLEVVRLVGLAIVWPRQAHWRSGEAEEECWS